MIIRLKQLPWWRRNACPYNGQFRLLLPRVRMYYHLYEIPLCPLQQFIPKRQDEEGLSWKIDVIPKSTSHCKNSILTIDSHIPPIPPPDFPIAMFHAYPSFLRTPEVLLRTLWEFKNPSMLPADSCVNSNLLHSAAKKRSMRSSSSQRLTCDKNRRWNGVNSGLSCHQRKQWKLLGSICATSWNYSK